MVNNPISPAKKRKVFTKCSSLLLSVQRFLPFWWQQKVSFTAFKDSPVMTQNQNKHHTISSHSADSEQVEDDLIVQTQIP